MLNNNNQQKKRIVQISKDKWIDGVKLFVSEVKKDNDKILNQM